MLKKFFTVLLYVFAGIGFFLVIGYVAVRFGLTNESGIIDTQRESFLGGAVYESVSVKSFEESEEWRVLEEALIRDASVIDKAAHDAGVPSRLIVANLVAEQLRLFFTEREAYKQFFYPLKMLGPQTQFSWGVMGMKEETAMAVEAHLKDSSSPFYLGTSYEHLLDFPPEVTDIKTERFRRMTDQHDHYYSYLYAGLYLRQLMTQWERSGFTIAERPDILATLYNIGFTRSLPKPDPKVGGAEITIGTTTYSFGGLAGTFYRSDLLTDVFPH